MEQKRMIREAKKISDLTCLKSGKSQGDWSGHIQANSFTFNLFLICCLVQTHTPVCSSGADQASSPTGGKTGIDREGGMQSEGWGGGPRGLKVCYYLYFYTLIG